MIKELSLKNFKCFRRLNLPLKSLTILAGLNGMGKSSILQSLLVLRQSERSGALAAGSLDLSGDLIDLGTVKDVFLDNASDDELAITLDWENHGYAQKTVFSFIYNLATSDRLQSSTKYDAPYISRNPLFGSGVQYLCAERLGPRKSLPLSESRVRGREIGKQGEYVSHMLLEYGEEVFGEADIRLLKAESASIKAATNLWLQEISPGVDLSFRKIEAIDAAVSSYTFSRSGDVRTPEFKPTSVGFGLSYSLPIIVACLIAQQGDLLLIENPEAHVHPRGQTRLGELLARTAASGVQILVETHSDHVVNGIRLAVHDKLLKTENAAFHYFEQAEEGRRVLSPQINEHGRLNFWPDGFFDEHETSLARLIAPT